MTDPLTAIATMSPRLLIVGPPGAGKSTAKGEVLGERAEEYLTVDADEFKAMIAQSLLEMSKEDYAALMQDIRGKALADDNVSFGNSLAVAMSGSPPPQRRHIGGGSRVSWSRATRS